MENRNKSDIENRSNTGRFFKTHGIPQPKMVLFDSGGTLCYDDDYDLLRATRAILPFFAENPRSVGAEELYAALRAAFDEIRPARAAGFEFSQYTIMRLACGRCGIEPGMDEDRFETIFRTALTPVSMTPKIDELLDCLNASGVRTGVISNTKYSGRSLRRRLDALLPRNRFEFFIASCDYALCKPKSGLFEIALAKAGLPACEVWYCGDSAANDVAGALGAGLFPVLYDRENTEELPAGTVCLRISDWSELIAVFRQNGQAPDGAVSYSAQNTT